MTREPGKPGEARGETKRRGRGIPPRKRRGELHGVTEGATQGRCHARPGASLRRSVTAFCHGVARKTCLGGSCQSPSQPEQKRAESWEGESSIEDGKR